MRAKHNHTYTRRGRSGANRLAQVVRCTRCGVENTYRVNGSNGQR
jgi:hypothetical protein